jgi:hypothetical protein
MEDGVTRYFCTDRGQHRRTKLGRFTPEHVEQLDKARAEGGWFIADMRDVALSVVDLGLPEDDARKHAPLKYHKLHPRRRSAAVFGKSPDQPQGVPSDTGRLVFRAGHGVGILKCPRCGRDKRISEERLREALTAGLPEVDISRI